MQSTASKRRTRPKVSPGRTIIEMIRVVWHLSPLFLINIAMFMAIAVTMYYFGGPVDTVTHAPVTFGETLYMCGVTGLTIGYGDIVPTTPIGRAAAVSVAFLGVLLTGLITSAAVLAVQRASGYNDSGGQ
ncbi:Ion channel [Caballeronia arvi]|uniref:Ion channel n=1 Tax=Caballeronia arvi TaxID=1777135 RepID=A0A158HP44_9BURK|nr:potassium channel family protein [Caballeronia arvi]SAL46182.1 Ion channel [Caballeronia arvi]